MRHLTRDELLDAAEGGEGGRDHLERCTACREEVQALWGVLNEAASDKVPEPSPLFWAHFSSRVSEGVQREADARARAKTPWSWPWRRWRLALPAAAGALATVLLLITLGRVPPAEQQGQRPTAPASGRATQTTPAPAVEGATSADEESWTVLSALVSEVDPDATTLATTAAGTPGAADSAVLQLSDEERGELGRLLQAEIERHHSNVEG